ncbi:MAG: restriction endonuclease [Methanosarcinaceae archaeon]|nr:restriction endonuclease [Methanosarcinaceae archaeon]
MAKWTLEYLLSTTPSDLENLVAHLFKQMGYRASVTQYSRDGGVDIELSLEHFGIFHRWLVQVKRYADAVGVKEVREYSSLRYRDNVDGVIIVTTSSFTKEAEGEAAEHNVKLIGGALLVEMLNHYCLNTQTQLPSAASTPELPDKKNSAIDGAILKRGENILSSESVVIDRDRLTMIVTNKNIFFKKGTGGMLSNKSEIFRRIGTNEIIGVHAETKHIFLLTGAKNIEIINIQPKNRERVLELLGRLRADYLKGEYLLRLAQVGVKFLILTNKRLAIINMHDGSREEINVKGIIGSRIIKGGMFKKAKLIVSESGDDFRKREIEVDNAVAWQKAIGDAVRVS